MSKMILYTETETSVFVVLESLVCTRYVFLPSQQENKSREKRNEKRTGNEQKYKEKKNVWQKGIVPFKIDVFL